MWKLSGAMLAFASLTAFAVVSLAIAEASPSMLTDTASTTATTGVTDVAALLAELPTRSFDSETPDYDRDAFGPPWADEDRNGCDTRNDILARDLEAVEFKAGTHGCVVLSGVLNPDPYTGQKIAFTRGSNTSNDVQIDHVVSLADAWFAGAYAWSDAERQAYANDPLVLLAVDGGANRAKSASRADQWLPDDAFACEYAARQIEIKAIYGLAVTDTERLALNQVLTHNCS
jgi:hypothetical protein